MERLARNEEDEAGHGICVGRQSFEVPERRPFASSSRGAGGVLVFSWCRRGKHDQTV